MRFSIVAVLLLTALPAAAHLGYENETEIRIFSDQMRVITRTSIPFAWAQLGDRAPAAADQAGQEIARPLLTAAAPSLFEITAGGEPMHPVSSDCVFEPGNDVAFVLNFDRPKAWPVVVRANFMSRLGSLDSGTIRVFDYSASRFSRDLKPIAEKTIDQRDATISFSLSDSPRLAPQTAKEAAASPTIETHADRPLVWFGLLAGLIGIVVAALRWKSRQRA